MAVVAFLAVGYGLSINLLAFVLFGIDKRRAAAGLWRLRESTLIGVALAGGWLGAKAGQRRFRHKTRKQPFARRLNAAGLLPLALLAVLAAAVLWLPVEAEAASARMAEAFGRILDGGAWLGGDAPSARPMPTRFGPGSGDGM